MSLPCALTWILKSYSMRNYSFRGAIINSWLLLPDIQEKHTKSEKQRKNNFTFSFHLQLHLSLISIPHYNEHFNCLICLESICIETIPTILLRLMIILFVFLILLCLKLFYQCYDSEALLEPDMITTDRVSQQVIWVIRTTSFHVEL